MNVASDTLYEEDFYAWTQQQADPARGVPLYAGANHRQRRWRLVPGAWDRSSFRGAGDARAPESMNAGR